MRRLLLTFLFLPWLMSSAMYGQSYPVSSIIFSGDPAFGQAELLAASGLKAGASLDQAAMQAAAQRLDATGMFARVNFRFDGKRLQYELTPAADLLPAQFDNFPWWDDKMLLARMEVAVPLFHGSLAMDSGTQQKLLDALTALLAEKQVSVKITAEPGSDLKTGQPAAIVFKIVSPAVQVGAVTFSGGSGSGRLTSQLSEVAVAAAGQEYSARNTPPALSGAVENLYKDKGYLEVHVASVIHGEPALDGANYRVPMTVSFDEGNQYRLDRFTLSGSVLMSEADFVKSALLKPGDVVEQAKLRRTMQMVSGPYVTRGYLRARITALPEFHRDQKTVEYAINVTPGEVYRMGKLEVKYLDADRTALVFKNWKLHEGDAYDASYPALFLKKDAKDLHALDGYSATYKQYEDEGRHVVDLVVSFLKGGPLG